MKVQVSHQSQLAVVDGAEPLIAEDLYFPGWGRCAVMKWSIAAWCGPTDLPRFLHLLKPDRFTALPLLRLLLVGVELQRQCMERLGQGQLRKTEQKQSKQLAFFISAALASGMTPSTSYMDCICMNG